MTSSTTETSKFAPWLHAYAWLFCVATFGLIILGGTVTSKGVGLAVPDWPGTYGYNMFLFPISLWKGGIFWEHTHRLAGSLIGMMAIAMCVWLGLTQWRSRRWLAWFGVATLVLVIAQGVMGGLRVTQIDYRWGIVHGVTAQLFLCMTLVIVSATSRWWIERSGRDAKAATDPPDHAALPVKFSPLFAVSLVLVAVLLVQLVLGATMRHRGAALAIPDFPTAYGGLVPPFSQDEIDAAHDRLVPWDQTSEEASHVTQASSGAQAWHPKALDVGWHFAHRIGALAVLAAFGFFAVRLVLTAIMNRQAIAAIIWPTAVMGVFLFGQIMLGASVIWTHKHPEVATAHQALGSVILATSVLISLRLYRLRKLQPHPAVSQPPWAAHPTRVGLQASHA